MASVWHSGVWRLRFMSTNKIMKAEPPIQISPWLWVHSPWLHLIMDTLIIGFLAVMREPPQRRRFWHFTQAERVFKQPSNFLTGLPSLLSPTSTHPGNYFKKNLLSFMHRFIPSRPQLSNPSSRPWVTEAYRLGSCPETTCLCLMESESNWR